MIQIQIYLLEDSDKSYRMETRTVKPRNQLPNTLLPLMPMVVIIDRLCHVHQDLGELFGYFYDRLSRL
jgi:hypothetical protein